ncbi:MAG: pectinesterase family protein [Chitinophagaceae bacterium]
MKCKTIICLLLMITGITTSFSFRDEISYDLVVAADGSGDFISVQAAINAVPDFRKVPTRIRIKKGTYKEKIILPECKQNILFEGESADGVFITNDDFASKKNRFGEEMGTSGSSGFYIYGINILFRDITFQNTSGPVGQAVAVFVSGDKVQFYDCRFLGFQDTLYTYGKESRQYYNHCYIEGTVDFIFGSSTAVFDTCILYGKNSGYFTAASTPENRKYGYVFRHCELTGSGVAGSFLLGRPWRPYAKTVFIDCRIDQIVEGKGWSNWGNTANEQTAFYAEAGNSGEGSSTGKRVAWAKQLPDSIKMKYTLANIFGDWDPFQSFPATK